MLELTLKELEVVQKQQLTKLLKHAGSITHLAKMLDISPMVIYGWEERGRISKAGARLVGDHGALSEIFKAKDLRPDL